MSWQLKHEKLTHLNFGVCEFQSAGLLFPLFPVSQLDGAALAQ